MSEYNKGKIIKTYFTIDVLDDCWKITRDVYDEVDAKHCPQDLIGACKLVIENIKHDKELGADFGKWEYRVIKHEEDEENDWQTAYKVYKYKGKWRYKVDYDY